MKLNYTIFDDFNDRQLILSKHNFFEKFEIDEILKIASKIDFQKGFILENEYSTYRSSNIKWILKTEKTIWLYKKIIEACLFLNYTNYFFILNSIEPMQFSSYSSKSKGYYKLHNDCGNLWNNKNFNRNVRKLSFSIQLSDEDDYVGGDLKIYNELGECTIVPKKKGSITFFPSFFMHEVTEVIDGNRLSLVGWISGKNIL